MYDPVEIDVVHTYTTYFGDLVIPTELFERTEFEERLEPHPIEEDEFVQVWNAKRCPENKEFFDWLAKKEEEWQNG